MPYEDRYVAFIDILGFREMVGQMGRDPSFYRDLLDSLGAMRRTLPPRERGAATDLRVQTFSDSVIISAAPSPDGLWHLLFTAHDLANALLPRGVLLRGGVTRGRMHHDEDIVLGEAMIQAYDFESKVAADPRIVISRCVWLDSQKAASENEVWHAYHSSRLIRATDGPAFLHVLCEYQAFNRDRETSPGADRHPLFAGGQQIRAAIASRLEEAMDTPAHFAKVRAFAEYWNATVVRNRWCLWLEEIELPTGEAAGPVLPFRGFAAPEM